MCSSLYRRRRTTEAVVFAAAMLAAGAAGRALGGTDTWTGGSGNWGVGSNWSLGAAPASGDVASVTRSDATSRTVTLDVSTPALSGVVVDSTGSGAMVLAQDANTLSLSGGDEYVGYSGHGGVVQTGGTNSVLKPDAVYLGYSPGSAGTYSLSGTGTLTGGYEYIGFSGGGVMTQTGGSNSLSYDLCLGSSSGSSGTYSLFGGAASAGSVYVGGGSGASGGAGVVTIAGGSLTAAAAFQIWDTPGTGVTLDGGTLRVGTFGSSGNPGRFTWTSGTLAVTGSDGLTPSASNIGAAVAVAAGRSLSVTNTLSLPGGASLDVSGGGVSAGTLSVDGGGSPSLSGGSVSVSGIEYVGHSGTGSFAQSGGNHVAGGLYLGYDAGSAGTYSLSGTGYLKPGSEYVGYSGSGTVAQTGGSNWVVQSIYVGNNSGSSGGYSLSGGAATASDVYVGGGSAAPGGDGTVTVTGGSLTATGTLKIWDTAGTGVTLSGGTLTAGALDTSGNPGRFSWSAGTLVFSGGLTLSEDNLGADVILTPGRVLSVKHILTVPGGTNLSVAGGTVAPNNLVVDGGGTVNLASGGVSDGAEFIGQSGGGTFVQSGGSHAVSGAVYLGYNAGSSGTGTLTSGTFSATQAYVGLSGSGSFTQSGGSLNLRYLYVGLAAGANGVFNLTGGTAEATVIYVGGSSSSGGAGSLNVTGGACTAYSLLQIWNDTGGGVTLDGGTLSAAVIDNHAPGGFAWRSGTLSLIGATGLTPSAGNIGADVTIDAAKTLAVTHDITLPVNTSLDVSGGTATANNISVDGGSATLSAGTLTAENFEYVGKSGSGSLAQSGGVHTVNSAMYLGYNSGSSGTFVLSGGTASALDVYVGGSGTAAGGAGTVTVGGGTFVTTGTLKIWNTPGTGVSLSGGTLGVGSLDTFGNPARFSWTAGTLNVSGASGLALNGSTLGTGVTLGPGQSLDVTNTLTIPGGASLAVAGGALAAGAVRIDGTYSQTGGSARLGAAIVSGTGTLSATRVIADSLSVDGAASMVAGGGISRVGGLSISSPGRLDVSDNPLVIDYTGASPVDAVRQYLYSGYNGGNWQGLGGIVASPAAADPDRSTGVGYVEAADLGVTAFAGESCDATTLLLRYTYYGDLNLDGVINADDYALIDRGFASRLADAHWDEGDLNYDGQVTSADYLLMDRAYALQNGGTLSPGLLAEREAEFGSRYVAELVAAVPEPGAAWGLGIAGMSLLGKRRRQRRR